MLKPTKWCVDKQWLRPRLVLALVMWHVVKCNEIACGDCSRNPFYTIISKSSSPYLFFSGTLHHLQTFRHTAVSYRPGIRMEENGHGSGGELERDGLCWRRCREKECGRRKAGRSEEKLKKENCVAGADVRHEVQIFSLVKFFKFDTLHNLCTHHS